MVPKEHVEFADKILHDAGVPDLPPEEDERMRLLGWTEAIGPPADRGGPRATPRCA